ncbi:unnamed protein product [Aspergillus oryzae RIB40]|nr:unnamed protein product [Aspergillus oryzae RIB40]BAE62512.1 unnamed protein product [Aspergillus oryzae RIB40]
MSAMPSKVRHRCISPSSLTRPEVWSERIPSLRSTKTTFSLSKFLSWLEIPSSVIMPPSTESDFESSPRPSIEIEKQNLLEQGLLKRESKRRPVFSHIGTLYIVNGFLIFMVIVLARELWKKPVDPSLQVYSPANDVVEYIPQQHFRAALFNQTEYMGFPTDETDKLWSDLYNFGISTITEDEAKKLHSPTIPIFGTKKYLIQLDVWHELHCLNDLRKTLYPERYTMDSLDSLKFPNGTINRDTDMFRHWDHCIDSIRQALMCHADVSPIPFHINVPARKGIFPRLATTHTCRNFTKIQEWARERFAGEWRVELEPEEAQYVIDTAGFSQDPEEDIQFLYELFPGDKFFKYWREHPYNGGDGV